MTGIIVDAHTHIWDLGLTPQPWIEPDAASTLKRNFSLQELKDNASQTSVKQAIVVQTVNELKETERLLLCAESESFIAGVVGWTDFTSPDGEGEIERLLAGPGGNRLLGFRHVFAAGEADQWMYNGQVNATFQTLARLNLSFDLLLREQELPLALSLVRRHPEVTFVLDHLAKPDVRGESFEPWRTYITALAHAPNVHAKFSGLPYEADWRAWSAETLAPFFEIALQVFTSERLIFATDWPVCTVAGSYTKVLDEQVKLCHALTPPEVEMMLGGNARKAYRIRFHHSGENE